MLFLYALYRIRIIKFRATEVLLYGIVARYSAYHRVTAIETTIEVTRIIIGVAFGGGGIFAAVEIFFLLCCLEFRRWRVAGKRRADHSSSIIYATHGPYLKVSFAS